MSLYTEIVDSGGDSEGTSYPESLQAQSSTLRLCPTGPVAVSRRSWRVAPLALITGNGSGPDGNSLTVDYRRSKGSGAESADWITCAELSGHLCGLALILHSCRFDRFPTDRGCGLATGDDAPC